MDRLLRVVFLVAALGLSALGQPLAAAACSGPTLSLEDAVAKSDGAIYAGRITRATPTTFWMDISIDVDVVVRGSAATELPRAQAAPSACEPIRVGEYGFIVRGISDPENSSEDRFYVLSRSAGLAALAEVGLPDTAMAGPADAAPALPVGPALAGLAGFIAIVATWRRVRRLRG
jgi:hypothetical protein